MIRNIKKIVALLITVILSAFFEVPGYAATSYKINNVSVRYNDFKSEPGGCWEYAKSFYRKIWGSKAPYSSRFNDATNMLKNLEKNQLVFNEQHLKAYVSQASLGSVLRICPEEKINSDDNKGHSLIIVKKDSAGLVVFEGGLSSYPYCREKYYTWSGLVKEYDKYTHIKYIKWPKATAIRPVITIVKSSSEIYAGQSRLMRASTNIGESVSWNSSNSAIAKIDKNGVLNANKVGTVTITASTGSLKATQKITVKAPKVKIKSGNIFLNKGRTMSLSGVTEPSGMKLAWSSSDNKIATVSSNGVVTGKKAGYVRISATVKGTSYKASITIRVK